MKYVSLIRLMSMYGYKVKEEHCVFYLPAADIRYEAKEDFTPFDIEINVDVKNHMTETNPDQIMNRLTSKNICMHSNVYYSSFNAFEVPPILEVEWLAKELGLIDEYTEVMNQMGYAYMAWVMTYVMSNKTDNNVDRWLRYIEENEVIVEVEEVEDAPYILTEKAMPTVTLPTFRTWADVLLYGKDFPSIFYKCIEQSIGFKELYHHMPVILALFMRDYCFNKLDNWSKQERLDIENSVLDFKFKLANYPQINDLIYTYSLSSDITHKDVELMRYMLDSVYDKLHELNTRIGIISYVDYKRICGVEKTYASIRLTNMSIDWNDEIYRANRKKKKNEEEQAENNASEDDESHDEDSFDEF